MENIMEPYWLWFCQNKEIYRPHLGVLIQVFGNPKAVFEGTEREIWECRGLNESQKSALLRSRRFFDYEKSVHELGKAGIRFISCEHPDYPKRLKNICDFPFGIFLKGALPDEDQTTVAVVGARRCSSYGKHQAEAIGEALAMAGAQIVSGMAMGIDGYAQWAAVRAGGQSFGVLGCGVDVCYPARNRQLYESLCAQGGVLSEYPPGREPLALHFPMRNRLISGMADCLVVVEARERSGSLITADLALEQGVDVIAVPGKTDDPLSVGCNRLISQGAGIFLNCEELLESLNLRLKKKKKNKKSEILLETKEILLYSCVDFVPKSLHELTAKAGLPPQEVMAVLTSLEMKGLIEEPMKNYYTRLN